jgi:sugar phosphate isomerase/epimerase
MDDNLYIHIPFELLLEKFDVVEQVAINVEILFSGDTLDSVQDRDLDRVKNWLNKNKLLCTIHAPFRDMSPGSVDTKVRQITLERYLHVIQIAKDLQPRCMVIHPGFDDMHDDESEKTRWLANSLNTWETMLAHAGNFTFCVENVFQTNPETILTLLRALDTPQVGHCFDTGHFNLFARCTLDEWFDKLGAYIREVHLHDNHGERDDHLAVGEGQIDFDHIFTLLTKHHIKPELVLEAHTEQQALLAINRMKQRQTLQSAEVRSF